MAGIINLILIGKVCKMMNEKYYTTEEIAKLLNVAVLTVRRWILSGKLSAYKIGRSYRISETQLKEFLQRSEN